MGRNKGERERVRGDYDVRPKNWLDKKSLAFLSKGESRHIENLQRMNDYLCRRNAQTEWYNGSCSGEIALLAPVNQRCHLNIQHEAHRCGVKCNEWAPVKGGESLRQNIPLRTFQDLIRNDNPNKSYPLYIVSENDTIFYVGKADNPIRRLCERLNPYAKNEPFTNFLRRYIYDAFSSWRVQLLTLQDCESFVVESLLMPEYDAKTIRSEVHEKYITNTLWAMGQAERVLIWIYRPCINGTHTPFPTQLPAKYSDSSVPCSHVLSSSQRK
jgi:hypothetical protein